MDLVNQGKGDVMVIWGTNDELKLNEIYSLCSTLGHDFWNPDPEFKERTLKLLENVWARKEK